MCSWKIHFHTFIPPSIKISRHAFTVRVIRISSDKFNTIRIFLLVIFFQTIQQLNQYGKSHKLGYKTYLSFSLLTLCIHQVLWRNSGEMFVTPTLLIPVWKPDVFMQYSAYILLGAPINYANKKGVLRALSIKLAKSSTTSIWLSNSPGFFYQHLCTILFISLPAFIFSLILRAR